MGDAEVPAILREVNPAEGAVRRDVHGGRGVDIQGGTDLGKPNRRHLRHLDVASGESLPDVRGLGTEAIAPRARIAGDKENPLGDARRGDHCGDRHLEPTARG